VVTEALIGGRGDGGGLGFGCLGFLLD
jgi:hypothetical protein